MSEKTAVNPAAIGALSAKINNYTDYETSGDHHVRVAVVGKVVTVSGVIKGTGTAGYVPDLSLPAPAFYTDGNAELIANALIFYARNQSTGSTIQLRCGGNYGIYREASMTNNQWYAFGFSYCCA